MHPFKEVLKKNSNTGLLEIHYRLNSVLLLKMLLMLGFPIIAMERLPTGLLPMQNHLPPFHSK